MLFGKPALIALPVIPLCGLVTLFAALNFAGFVPVGQGADGFAELSVDAVCSDRAIGEALSGAGITGYISESNSWVFLDDFGELKRVPLDSYDDALEPFDPRNDGYARKLRSFFVNNGRRRFFIGLGTYSRTAGSPGAPLTYRQIEERIGAILGKETPYTLNGFSAPQGGSPLWPLLLSLAASGGLLFLTLKKPAAFPPGFSRLAAAFIPVQGALALSGPGGFACAAALLGCFECLLPPIRENLINLRQYRRRFRLDRVFRTNWLLALLFLLVFIAAAVVTPVNFLIAALAAINAFAVFGLLLWLEGNPERGAVHRRFLPIPIREPSFSLNSFPRITLPLAFACFLSLFLPLFGPDRKGPAGFSYKDISFADAPDIPAKEEYEAHFMFQTSFSLHPLGPREQAESGAYRSYYLGEDGLIAGSREMANPAVPDYPEIPPFPLGELASFLEDGENGVVRGNETGDILAALIILLLALPRYFGRVWKKRNMGSFLIFADKGDKQVAA
jgi:hypothetical protein